MLKQSVSAGQAAPEKPWSTGVPRARELPNLHHLLLLQTHQDGPYLTSLRSPHRCSSSGYRVQSGSGAGAVPEEGGDLTIFESLGIAAEDVAVARLVYNRALAAGRGEALPQTLL